MKVAVAQDRVQYLLLDRLFAGMRTSFPQLGHSKSTVRLAKRDRSLQRLLHHLERKPVNGFEHISHRMQRV